MQNFHVKSSENYLKISDKLLTRPDDELDANLGLSINFSLYVIAMSLLSSLLIGTQKVISFSVFSPRHSNLPSNYFSSSLII